MRLLTHFPLCVQSMKGNSNNCQHCHAVLVTQVRPKRQSQPKFKTYAKYKQEVS